MKKILIILILGIFLISLTSAQEEQSWGYVRAGDCISLTQTCDNCTFVNITRATYPNKTDYGLSESIKMQKTGTSFNHSFCETTSLGQYILSGDHDLDGEIGTWNADFISTTSGFESTSAQSILYVIVLVISCLVLALCGYGAIRIPFQNTRNDESKIISISHFKYLKIMFAFFSYLILLWIINLMILITNNFLTSTVAFTFFSMVYSILLFCFYPILMLTLAIFVVNLLHDKKIRKILKRGIFPKW